MAGIVDSSLAAGTGSSVNNVQFAPTAQDVPRKILVIGSYDPLKTSVVANVPAQVFSPEDAAVKYGNGSMLHRLVLAAWKGGKGTPTYVIPQAEAGGAVAAAGEITYTVTTTEAGTIPLYISGERVPVNISASATVENIADATVAAINANTSLPVTAAKVAITFEVALTAKTKGTYGNEISIDFNLNQGEALPSGMTAAVSVAMAGGTGTPDITLALAGMGTADNANLDFFTGGVHGYLKDTTTLDAISTYVGPGNSAIGLYQNTVHRPMQFLTGDTATGSAGLTALIAVSDLRLLDRGNGVISAPDSPNHPSEIAAQAIGHRERVAAISAASDPIGEILEGVFPGSYRTAGNVWTESYDNRDTAVKAGISTTMIKNGALVIQDMVSFYRPADVPVSSNGYRDFSDLSKLQNILYNQWLLFEQAPWPGSIIVGDAGRVTGEASKIAKDITSVIDALIGLLYAFEEKAWIFSADFSINFLASDKTSVTIRPGETGFTNKLKVQLSGNTKIVDTETQFDTAIAA